MKKIFRDIKEKIHHHKEPVSQPAVAHSYVPQSAPVAERHETFEAPHAQHTVPHAQHPVAERHETFEAPHAHPVAERHEATFVEAPHAQHTVPYAHTVAPTYVEKEVVERPTVVKETILPEEKVVIQPVVHREREQMEVHEVVQPMKERDIMPTKVLHATLPSETVAERRENDSAFHNEYRQVTGKYVPSVEYAPKTVQTTERAPIVEEHVHKKIVEEVQPVLYKEVIQPTLIQETQPIYEKVIEPPVLSFDNRPVRELGVKHLEQPVVYESRTIGVTPPQQNPNLRASELV
jgi:hypothetical protein